MKLKKTIGRTNVISNAQRINPSLAQNTIKDTNTKYLVERFKDDYMISILPSAKKPKTDYTIDTLKTDLDYLNTKLETVRKSITSWDVYNILGVATTPEDVNSWLNTLTPNSSFIINLDSSYKINNDTYSAGDIVFKDITNNTHLIKAQGAGVFFPQKFEQTQGNTYKLTYTFSTIIPSEDTELPPEPMGEEAAINRQMYTKFDLKTEELPYKCHTILAPKGDVSILFSTYKAKVDASEDAKNEQVAQADGTKTEQVKVIKPVIYTFWQDSATSAWERIWLDKEDLAITLTFPKSDTASKSDTTPESGTTNKEPTSFTITNNSDLNILVEVR